MRQGRDVIMSERGDAMCRRDRLGTLMSVLGFLEGLARVLVSRQVIRFSALFRGTVSVRRLVM
jgi:hypothetical protein